MKRLLRYGALVLAVLVCILALLFFQAKTRGDTAASGKQTRVAPQSVPVVAVGMVKDVADVEVHRYTGQVVPISSVDLKVRISGEILDVAFTEGDRVRAGDVLFRIDPIRYEAAVERDKATVAECKAKAAYAKVTYERAESLYDRNATSKDAVDSAKSGYDAAQAALRAAEAELVAARDDLNNTRVVAPIAGKIGIAAYTRGNYITPSSGVLATIVDMNALRVRFSMSTRDYLALFRNERTLKENASVRLLLSDDSAYELRGSIDLLDNRADGRSDTVAIYARFDNPEGVLIPDAAVTVLLSRINGGNLPAIAPSAVMYDASSPYVYVVDARGAVARRDIALGAASGGAQIVRSGLTAGESVIIDGMHKTAPGQTVEAKQKEWLSADPPEELAAGIGS